MIRRPLNAKGSDVDEAVSQRRCRRSIAAAFNCTPWQAQPPGHTLGQKRGSALSL